MFFNPEKARATIRMAGSTNFINYTEITIRLIPGIALLICAHLSKHALFFEGLGWIIVSTSVVLYTIPRTWHHQYAVKAADLLKPNYLRLVAPISILGGGFFIYSILG